MIKESLGLYPTFFSHSSSEVGYSRDQRADIDLKYADHKALAMS